MQTSITGYSETWCPATHLIHHKPLFEMHICLVLATHSYQVGFWFHCCYYHCYIIIINLPSATAKARNCEVVGRGVALMPSFPAPQSLNALLPYAQRVTSGTVGPPVPRAFQVLRRLCTSNLSCSSLHATPFKETRAQCAGYKQRAHVPWESRRSCVLQGAALFPSDQERHFPSLPARGLGTGCHPGARLGHFWSHLHNLKRDRLATPTCR